MEVLTKKLNNGRTVLARNLKEYGLSPVTYANRTQANKKAAEVRQQLGMNYVVKVTYDRPFYVEIRPLMELFAECHEMFRTHISNVAHLHGKTVEQVYVWWREYSDSVSGEGGQSAVMEEFVRWYANQLGPRVVDEICNQCGRQREAWQDLQDNRCPMHAVPEPYSSCDGVLMKGGA